MKIARVLGSATLSRMHPAMHASSLRCVEVVERIDDLQKKVPGNDLIIAWDLCGCGEGDLVALAEGPEAAAPFKPDVKPIDASIVAILDHLEVDPSN
ncbi:MULTISPECIES: EutN/CcmL family microcompartment protein [Pirellulaceae]|uniref:Microcompartment protein CcmK/EutM n=1 Tax=Aporhodopirellula rubra TaxID=980271 RepID=A0A7W5H6W0_9BACT|nr:MULTISPECIES: EutN/CcmL family microcompartment protein [Pirellulaceae]EMI41913.1 carbon dioxide concentrating mechanism protein CcmL [Rhodopirellula sp. SWK7]MBB3207728.1 microcompartment protein CcmK/EutM [Aporhodopirellula rubra]